MKLFSLNRFKKNSKAIISKCYLGLYEIVVPVFQGNKLACALYIGTFILEGQKADVLSRSKKYSAITGTKFDEYVKSIEETPEISLFELEKLRDMTDSIALFVHLLIEKSGVKLTDTSKWNKLNKSTSEGIHWAAAFVMEYVDLHYNKDVNLRRIARMLFLNPDYLSRLFFKETNKNFVDYLNERRIFEAKRIISQTNIDITSIYYDVGFKSKPHFNKMFKRFCSSTPSEFKKSLKNQTERQNITHPIFNINYYLLLPDTSFYNPHVVFYYSFIYFRC